MFENKDEENVVEQTLESEKNTASGASVENTPTISTDNLEKPKDYLDPSLFDEIKVVSINEDNKDKSFNENDQKLKNFMQIHLGIYQKTLLWKVE